MEHSMNRLKHVLNSLQKDLECAICLQWLTDPVKASCNHEFCRKCFMEIFSSSRLSPVKPSCPLCKRNITKRGMSEFSKLNTVLPLSVKLFNKIMDADKKFDESDEILKTYKTSTVVVEEIAKKVQSERFDNETNVDVVDQYSSSNNSIIDVSDEDQKKHDSSSSLRDLRVYINPLQKTSEESADTTGINVPKTSTDEKVKKWLQIENPDGNAEAKSPNDGNDDVESVEEFTVPCVEPICSSVDSDSDKSAEIGRLNSNDTSLRNDTTRLDNSSRNDTTKMNTSLHNKTTKMNTSLHNETTKMNTSFRSDTAKMNMSFRSNTTKMNATSLSDETNLNDTTEGIDADPYEFVASQTAKLGKGRKAKTTRKRNVGKSVVKKNTAILEKSFTTTTSKGNKKKLPLDEECRGTFDALRGIDIDSDEELGHLFVTPQGRNLSHVNKKESAKTYSKSTKRRAKRTNTRRKSPKAAEEENSDVSDLNAELEDAEMHELSIEESVVEKTFSERAVENGVGEGNVILPVDETAKQTDNRRVSPMKLLKMKPTGNIFSILENCESIPDTCFEQHDADKLMDDDSKRKDDKECTKNNKNKVNMEKTSKVNKTIVSEKVPKDIQQKMSNSSRNDAEVDNVESLRTSKTTKVSTKYVAPENEKLEETCRSGGKFDTKDSVVEPKTKSISTLATETNKFLKGLKGMGRTRVSSEDSNDVGSTKEHGKMVETTKKIATPEKTDLVLGTASIEKTVQPKKISVDGDFPSKRIDLSPAKDARRVTTKRKVESLLESSEALKPTSNEIPKLSESKVRRTLKVLGCAPVIDEKVLIQDTISKNDGLVDSSRNVKKQNRLQYLPMDVANEDDHVKLLKKDTVVLSPPDFGNLLETTKSIDKKQRQLSWSMDLAVENEQLNLNQTNNVNVSASMLDSEKSLETRKSTDSRISEFRSNPRHTDQDKDSSERNKRTFLDDSLLDGHNKEINKQESHSFGPLMFHRCVEKNKSSKPRKVRMSEAGKLSITVSRSPGKSGFAQRKGSQKVAYYYVGKLFDDSCSKHDIGVQTEPTLKDICYNDMIDIKGSNESEVNNTGNSGYTGILTQMYAASPDGLNDVNDAELNGEKTDGAGVVDDVEKWYKKITIDELDLGDDLGDDFLCPGQVPKPKKQTRRGLAEKLKADKHHLDMVDALSKKHQEQDFLDMCEDSVIPPTPENNGDENSATFSQFLSLGERKRSVSGNDDEDSRNSHLSESVKRTGAVKDRNTRSSPSSTLVKPAECDGVDVDFQQSKIDNDASVKIEISSNESDSNDSLTRVKKNIEADLELSRKRRFLEVDEQEFRNIVLHESDNEITKVGRSRLSSASNSQNDNDQNNAFGSVTNLFDSEVNELIRNLPLSAAKDDAASLPTSCDVQLSECMLDGDDDLFLNTAPLMQPSLPRKNEKVVDDKSELNEKELEALNENLELFRSGISQPKTATKSDKEVSSLIGSGRSARSELLNTENEKCAEMEIVVMQEKMEAYRHILKRKQRLSSSDSEKMDSGFVNTDKNEVQIPLLGNQDDVARTTSNVCSNVDGQNVQRKLKRPAPCGLSDITNQAKQRKMEGLMPKKQASSPVQDIILEQREKIHNSSTHTNVTESKFKPGLISIVTTGLSAADMRGVDKFASIFNIHISKKFSNRTTHVIVNSDSRLMCNRTLKYFQGVVNHKWVVSAGWVFECLIANCVVFEEPFEIIGNDEDANHAPSTSRLKKTKLFKDFEICCVGKFQDMTRENLIELVEAGGASTVYDPTSFTYTKKNSLVITSRNSVENLNDIANHFKVTCILWHWILDTIGSFSSMPMNNYLLAQPRVKEVPTTTIIKPWKVHQFN